MTTPRTLLLVVGAVVLIGVVAVWGLRSVAGGDGSTETETGTAAAPPALAPPDHAAVGAAPAPVAPASEAPPPWATGAAADQPAATEAATAADAEAARRAARMAEVQQSMDALVGDALERSAASTVHVRRALDALDALDDPAVEAQIDLEAVRHNLAIGERMQALVRELRATMAEPRTPERQARIDALQAEIKALQAQVRTDLGPGAKPPMPPAGG